MPQEKVACLGVFGIKMSWIDCRCSILHSPHPLPLRSLFFALPVLFPSRKVLEMPAMQAIVLCGCQALS